MLLFVLVMSDTIVQTAVMHSRGPTVLPAQGFGSRCRVCYFFPLAISYTVPFWVMSKYSVQSVGAERYKHKMLDKHHIKRGNWVHTIHISFSKLHFSICFPCAYLLSVDFYFGVKGLQYKAICITASLLDWNWTAQLVGMVPLFCCVLSIHWAMVSFQSLCTLISKVDPVCFSSHPWTPKPRASQVLGKPETVEDFNWNWKWGQARTGCVSSRVDYFTSEKDKYCSKTIITLCINDKSFELYFIEGHEI